MKLLILLQLILLFNIFSSCIYSNDEIKNQLELIFKKTVLYPPVFELWRNKQKQSEKEKINILSLDVKILIIIDLDCSFCVRGITRWLGCEKKFNNLISTKDLLFIVHTVNQKTFVNFIHHKAPLDFNIFYEKKIFSQS